MYDIQTFWDIANIRGDWAVANADLADGSDLSTAVLISLFTDRVANPGDIIPDGTKDTRGWWGDNQPDGNTIPIGSRLWLLQREKATNDTRQRAITYANEALSWMVSDGVAASVSVDAQWNAGDFLAMKVTVERRDGTTEAINFKWAWNQI